MDSSGTAIISVIGSPGSGKGTLCKRLSAEYELAHLSVGDVLRELASLPGTDIDIVNRVQRGELVSVEEIASILKSRVEKEWINGRKRILLDGFPRRLDQAAAVERQIGSPLLVLFFNCPEKVAENRFLTRQLAGRETDDAQTIQKRYQEFENLNPDIVEDYRKKGILLEIDTSGETEVSYQKLVNTLTDTQAWNLLVASASAC